MPRAYWLIEISFPFLPVFSKEERETTINSAEDMFTYRSLIKSSSVYREGIR